MKEKLYTSVEEMFGELDSEILEFLNSKDLFWVSIKNNTITDDELDKHEALLSELGIFTKESVVARAIQLIKIARKHSLPTPININQKGS